MQAAKAETDHDLSEDFIDLRKRIHRFRVDVGDIVKGQELR